MSNYDAWKLDTPPNSETKVQCESCGRTFDLNDDPHRDERLCNECFDSQEGPCDDGSLEPEVANAIRTKLLEDSR